MNLEQLKENLRKASGTKLPSITILGDNKVMYTKICTVTNTTYCIVVPKDAHDLWKAGENIQTALPAFKPEEREFLISGNTPEEFKEIFKNIQDD